MNATLNGELLEIQLRERTQTEVTAKMLALCFAKPLETFIQIPKDWFDGVMHVDYPTEVLWPDMERELLPMLNNLSGMLAHKSRVPTDICIVRPPGGKVFSIAVRYS